MGRFHASLGRVRACGRFETEHVSRRLAGGDLRGLLGRVGLLAADVDAPTGQLCGETRVLPFPPDRKREHPLGHDHGGDPRALVDVDADDLCRTQRRGDELGRILGPRDDVDLLPAQLRDDRLDAGAALAHGRADRVEARLPARDSDLGTAASLARDRLDLDQPAVDLRDLELEEAAQEVLVAAADEDLRPAGRSAHLQHEGLQGLADAVVLGRRLLGRREDRLDLRAGPRSRELEDDRARLDPADMAGDEIGLEARVLAEELFALGLAKTLQDDLLGALRSDPAEIVGGDLLDLDEVAHRRVGSESARFGHVHLEALVLDGGDDLFLAGDVDLARLGIDPDVDVLVPCGDIAVGRANGFLDRLDERLPGNALFGIQLQEGADEVTAHDLRLLVNSLRFRVSGSRLSTRNVGGPPRSEAAVRRARHSGV